MHVRHRPDCAAGYDAAHGDAQERNLSEPDTAAAGDPVSQRDRNRRFGYCRGRSHAHGDAVADRNPNANRFLHKERGLSAESGLPEPGMFSSKLH